MSEVVLHVLLIEDDEVDFVGLRRAFDLIGVDCNLRVAQTGEDGWTALCDIASASERMPIVLLDINLPGQSGLETLKLIRQSSLTKDTRVIVWSNIRNPEEEETAYELEIEGFLLKSDPKSSYVKVASMLKEYWLIDNR